MDFSDHEELDRRLKNRKRRQRSDIFWNFLTVCLVLATIALAGVLMMIFSNPSIALNPFPPPTMPALVIYPTSTPTPMQMPPTWTPTPRVTDTPQLVTVTNTPEPSLTPSSTISGIQTGDLVYIYALQGAPSAVKSSTFKPETGCSWQGIAGQVLDMQGQHLVSIGIVLKGTYDNKTISMQTISGTHTEYGDSGYEFQLGTTLLESTGLLSIQLVDQAGQPLSEKVIFNTFDTCDKNLILINFKQIR